jgi:inner membrane protein
MDTLTHALIGVAVAGLSGHHPSVADPVYIATVLGAQAPDFDIVAQVRGNMAYLKQHRAFSHSIPGIGLWSAAIAGLIHLFMPQASVGQLLFWAFAGGLSHTLIDYFNTHGTAILWPFRRERKSYPLLNVFDPCLMSLLLSLYLYQLPIRQLAFASLTAIVLYIFLRYMLKVRATNWLKARFAIQGVQRVWVMPCLTHLFSWDFVVETAGRHLNGRLGALFPVLEVKADLPRHELSPLAGEALKTSLGEFFTSFTPFIYLEEKPDETATRVNLYDLRYFGDRRFLHSATIVFDGDNLPCESYMHTLGRTVRVNG